MYKLWWSLFRFQINEWRYLRRNLYVKIWRYDRINIHWSLKRLLCCKYISYLWRIRKLLSWIYQTCRFLLCRNRRYWWTLQRLSFLRRSSCMYGKMPRTWTRMHWFLDYLGWRLCWILLFQKWWTHCWKYQLWRHKRLLWNCFSFSRNL